MIKALAPIIKADKIGDAAAVLELADIHDSEDFMTAFRARALSEDPRTPEKVTTAATPPQAVYKQNLSPYGALNGR